MIEEKKESATTRTIQPPLNVPTRTFSLLPKSRSTNYSSSLGIINERASEIQNEPVNPNEVGVQIK